MEIIEALERSARFYAIRRRRGIGPSGIAAALLIASACSPAEAPVSHSTRDPSNPAAPEGALPVARAPEAAAGSSNGAASPSAGPDGGAVVYVCPMHPEVTSNAPGTCPKCNMKLVPKK